MKKYYVDDKEVFEHQFTILLALSLSRTLQASYDSIVIVTETIKRFLEDGNSQNYGIGGRVFEVKEEKTTGTEDVYVSISAKCPNIDFKPTTITTSYIDWDPQYPVGNEIYYFGTLIPEEDLIKILNAAKNRKK